MNPSTALATVFVDELLRGGMREAVLAPGSRSAPLAFALLATERSGRLRLHVRIDERSAGFLALGLAKGGAGPVAVVTTSGTATANLHPAVLEASYAGVPLLVLTADRPPELRDTGANQSVDQLKLYGDAVRLFAEVGTPEVRAGQNAYWRSLACRALAAATGSLATRPGPIQLNVGLRDPLVPDEVDDGWPESLDGRLDGRPWTTLVRSASGAGRADAGGPADDLPARTVVVLGDGDRVQAAAAIRLAAVRGWPVIAEPSGQADAGEFADNVIDCAELLLAAPGFLPAHRPDRVLVVGRPTLSRVVGRLVAQAQADVVGAYGRWPDPSRQAARVLSAVPAVGPAGQGEGFEARWLASWRTAAGQAREAVRQLLAGTAELTEPAAAAEVISAGGSLLVVGSSKPVRDLFLAGPRAGTRVLANRGAAGIDGMVSTAIGAALSHQRDGGGQAYALLGDLTFLHDANGLVASAQDSRPDLVIVVVNNDGGAIFGTLEQGAPGYADAFERLFGTPHGVDLQLLCGATGTAYLLVRTREELRSALLPGPGIRVVEVRTDRPAAIRLDSQLRAAVAQAVGL